MAVEGGDPELSSIEAVVRRTEARDDGEDQFIRLNRVVTGCGWMANLLGIILGKYY
jgi:hypothetical protein